MAGSRQTKLTDRSTKEEIVLIDVDALGKQAEVRRQYFIKGCPMLLEGRLRLDPWETQAGEKRSKLGVVLESFQFVGARSDDNNGLPLQNLTESYQEPLHEDLAQSQSEKISGPIRMWK
jgi:single-strand DNA-binding protein